MFPATQSQSSMPSLIIHHLCKDNMVNIQLRKCNKLPYQPLKEQNPRLHQKGNTLSSTAMALNYQTRSIK